MQGVLQKLHKQASRFLLPALPVLVSLLLPSALRAEDAASPIGETAILYDLGGRFDKSFNQLTYEGAMEFSRKTGAELTHIEIRPGDDKAALIRKAIDDGASLIVTTSLSWKPAIEQIAPEFPQVRFILPGARIDSPNVQSPFFRNEAAFLAGAAAALKSRSGTIGFVGGMDTPAVRNYQAGYEAGARHINPDIKLLSKMTGTTPDAFDSPFEGAVLAAAMVDDGADVLFAAAGTTGLGVYQAAKQGKVLAIGMDGNQNYLHPGTMLTSMVQRTDLVIAQSLEEIANGHWQGGIREFGLKQGMVDLAFDRFNAELFTQDAKDRINALRKEILAGRIIVPRAKED